MSLDLSNAVVTGFFSLPSASLAEANPAAYSQAMAEAPIGAGSCAHCGTGILHHVVIKIAGVQHFIGTDCAAKVGSESVKRCVRQGLTSEALAVDDAKIAASRAETARLTAERDAKLAAVAAQVSDLADRLADGRGGFRDSIASDLRRGVLPTGRGFSCMIMILAKQEGRLGSKAFTAALAALEARLEPVIAQYEAVYQ